MADVDALIREKPDNPYFWELKGNFLLLDRQVARSHRRICARRCNWRAATNR